MKRILGKKFSFIFISLLCIALLGPACITVSRADDTLTKDSGGSYLIYTPSDLVKFRDMVNGGSLDIKGRLMADIDLSGVCSASLGSWTPIADIWEHIYSGTFDGQGHKLTNLYIKTDADYAGLFGVISDDSEIKNLTVSGAVFGTSTEGETNVGCIAGWNRGTMKNCVSSGSVSSTGRYVGGIAGCNTGTVKNCVSTGSVSCTYQYAAGIVGYNEYGTVTNCAATGSASSVLPGGVVGWNHGGTVTNCGWLNTGPSKGIAYNDASGTREYITSFTAAALKNGRIVVACLPSISSLKITNGGIGTVALTTYPMAVADTSPYIVSADSAVDPSALADSSVSISSITVTGKSEGSGVLSVDVCITPTLFSGDCSEKTTAMVLNDLEVSLSVLPTSKPDGNGSDSCNAGFGALALLAVLPMFLRKRK